MSSAVTFYPWDIKNVHIFELGKFNLINEKKGNLDFLGYFSPTKMPLNIIFIRSGEKPLYISVNNFRKVDERPNSRVARFILDFQIIKTIENSDELKRISRSLIDEV